MCSVRPLRPWLCLVVLLSQVPNVVAQASFRFAGSTPVGTVAPSSQVQVAIAHTGLASSVQVFTTGIAGLDFTAAAGGSCATGNAYTSGATCTVNVAFTPLYPGERRGAVVLRSADGTTLGMSLLSGAATGPLAVLVPGAIHTVAGDNEWIYSGDGSVATQSSIFLPFGVALDAAGSMYITDSSNNRIRRVDGATAIMSTYAGSGNVGSTGDGGPATAASLSSPSCVVLDGAGNVFFSDSGNNVIRRVDAGTGILTTVAGRIAQHGYTGDGGSATSALLNTPNGLAFDSVGNLYIADTGNNVVRRVDASTNFISTVAGTGAAAFSGDGGLATAAKLNAPWSVTLASTGLIYIADQNNNRIRQIDTHGIISTVVGTGAQGFSGDGNAAAAALLNVPASVAVDVAGNLYIADAGNNRVRKVSVVTGTISTVAGNDGESFSGDGFSANLASLYGPYTLTIDQVGNLYIADVFHNRIRAVASQQASMVYPEIRVGRVSDPQFVQLEDDGNAVLTVGSIAAVSNAAVDAPTTVCADGQVLQSGYNCAIGADFAPTVIGDYVVGSITAASNAVNSPGTIYLAGKVLNVDPTQITLTSSLNPATVGNTVTFSVGITSPGTTPTGTVTFLDGTVTLGTATLSGNGTAGFPISTLSGGQHSITASYAGDASNAAIISSPLIEVIHDVQAPTSTSVSASANPAVAGAPLHLTAVVTVVNPGSGSGSIAGTVTFTDNGAPIGSAVITNGTGTFTTSTLSVGTHTLVASYGGSTNFLASTAAPLTEVIQLASTSANLATTVNPVVGSAGVTLVATVTGNGGIPTGLVTFLDGTTTLGSAPLTTHGTANLPLAGTALSVGTHSLTASYAGDQSDSPTLSPPLIQVVQQATTSTVVTSSLNPAGQGGLVRFAAKVTSTGGTPTGTVQFLDGATVIGSGSLDSTGTASMSTAALALGSHAINAVYGGDAFDAGSASTSLIQIIASATTAVTLSANNNPSIAGTPILFTVVVQGTGSVPSGTVTLKDATTGIGPATGTATLDSNGMATFSLANLSIGSHNINAGYNGDTNHTAVDSPVLVERVIQSTTTTLTSSTGQTNGGASITFTAKVLGSVNQPVTGPVNFLDGTVVVGQGTPDATGTATFTAATLAIGHHTITAAFTGDALSQASSSNPVGEVVTLAQTSTTLSSNTNPAFTGIPITLTVAVTGNGGTPTGNVTLLDGATSLGVLPLSATGTATLTSSTLTPGIHTLTASYAGDPLDAPSLSAPVAQQIVQRTTVTVTSAANPSLLLDNVAISVTVSNGVTAAATGFVTLTDGPATLGSAPLNSSGVAIFTLSAPTLGTHTLTATYPGDTQNQPATASLVQTVTLRPDTNSLTLSAANISDGQTVTMVAVVTGSGPRPPTGTVTFQSGLVVLGVAPLDANGVAAVTATPQQGSYNLVASYASDGLYASSASAPQALVVGPTQQFVFTMDPTSFTLKSGDHRTINIAVTTASNFADTLALGCAGLPAYATCTFSANQMPIGKGVTSQFSVVFDTGNPLGSGATASLHYTPSSSIFACLLPGILLLLGISRRKRLPSLFLSLLILVALGFASGCASSFSEKSTPAGNYTFRITGTGNTTGATQSGVETLTVTP